VSWRPASPDAVGSIGSAAAAAGPVGLKLAPDVPIEPGSPPPGCLVSLPTMPQSDPPSEHPDPARRSGELMGHSLRQLLGRVAGARQALPYLAALEAGLTGEGLGVLDVIPLPSLQRMGTQLASLPIEPEDRPLRALQVELLAALARRAGAPPTPRFVSTDLGPDKLEVMEVSDSEWAAASRQFGNDDFEPTDYQPR
jgi:hypothetical protein